jgi:hypothetical protein
MSEEIEVTVVSQPGLSVLVAEESVTTAIETSSVETATIDESSHAVVREDEFVVVSVGEQGPPGSGGGSGSTTETYITATAIGGQRIVVTNSSGEAIYAQNTDAAHANMATKITTGAAESSAEVTVQFIGTMTDVSFTWTPGATLYLGVNGLMTQTPPTSPAVFSKVVAVAETATKILLVQEPPVMLA